MRTGTESNTARIANYVAQAEERRIPPEVLDAARLCLADWVGVCTGAQNEPAAQIIHTVSTKWHSEGRATLMLGGRADPTVAALCNGTLAHCLDFDDTYVSANTHTSAPLWAAVLALGEETGASEADMLTAFVTGFETAARIGAGLGEAVTARGWHATGVFGRIGTAAACSLLLRLDERAVTHALGVAATQSSGLVASFGTMSKPFHAGKAAMDGVLSAQLAAGGFEASTNLLEPNAGLDGALVQDRSTTILRADFNSWELLNNSFKPYAACHLAHAAIDAARALKLGKEETAAIKSVDVYVSELADQVTGGKSGAPTNAQEAKFDLKHCIALALTGSALSADDFTDLSASAPAIIPLAQSVRVHSSTDFGYASARIQVILQNGSMRKCHIPIAKGHPGNPMTWDDMWKKFEALVEPAAGSRAEDIFEQIRQFGPGNGRALTMIRHLSAALQM